MEENIISLADAIAHNPMTTFRLEYKGSKYNAKYDNDQNHFYSYVKNERTKRTNVVIMKPNMVHDCKVYSQSKYNGYKVII